MHDQPMLSQRVTPPVPHPLPEGISTRALLRAYATDILATYPERAFEEDVIIRPFYGRLSLLINAPEDIRRVLIDNDAGYGRTRATMRIIRPMLGDGLFLDRCILYSRFRLRDILGGHCRRRRGLLGLRGWFNYWRRRCIDHYCGRWYKRSVIIINCFNFQADLFPQEERFTSVKDVRS